MAALGYAWDGAAFQRLQVDGSGNLKVAVTGAGSGGTSSADGATYTAGTTAGTPLMVARDDTSTTQLAEDKVGIARGTAFRAVHVNLRDSSGNEVSVGGGTQYAEDAASAGGESMTLAGAVRQDTISANTSTDGDYTYLKTDSAGRLYVNAAGVAVPVTDNGGNLSIDDGGNSITVDGTVTVQDGGGAISVDDNGSTISVDDGGGSLTVDGTVAVSGTVTVDSELTTADLDTGAGTDTRAVVGIAGAASGGAVLVQATSGGALKHDVTSLAGTAVDTNSGNKSAGTQRVVLATDQPQLTNALKVDGSAVTQPVSGTVTANPGGATPVLKNGLSTTVFSVIASQAAVLEDYYIYNPNSSVAYVQIFDVATSGGVTLGTTTPKWSVGVPATSAANVSRLGLSFANGIQVAATTTATGSTGPSSSLDTNWGYR